MLQCFIIAGTLFYGAPDSNERYSFDAVERLSITEQQVRLGTASAYKDFNLPEKWRAQSVDTVINACVDEALAFSMPIEEAQ